MLSIVLAWPRMYDPPKKTLLSPKSAATRKEIWHIQIKNKNQQNPISK